MTLLPVLLAGLSLSWLPAAALQSASPQSAPEPAPRALDRADPRPAMAENPLPAAMTLPADGRTPAPHPGPLPRNGYQSGRFTAQGQQVDFRFEAQAGELSLFDLATWGYARSWRSTAEIQILDEDGAPLLTQERPGAAAYRSFLPFVAPRDGTYRYRLAAKEEMFRYTLVRHSDYRPGDAGNLAFGERDVVHGHLAHPGDARALQIELEAGQEIALRVANDHSVARKQKDNRRRRQAPTEPEADFPDLVLSLARDGEPLTEEAPFVLFTPEEDGTYQVLVRATSDGQGGLFVVESERAPERLLVTGYVGDEEDDPVPGISLRFLREPASDLIGEVTSDEDGEFQLRVLPGRYSVHVRPVEGGAAEVVKATVDRDRELNLVWTR